MLAEDPRSPVGELHIGMPINLAVLQIICYKTNIAELKTKVKINVTVQSSRRSRSVPEGRGMPPSTVALAKVALNGHRGSVRLACQHFRCEVSTRPESFK